jgi:hypothetical protein
MCAASGYQEFLKDCAPDEFVPTLRAEPLALGERWRGPRQDREVSVKAHALQTTHLDRGKAVVVLQAPELAPYGSAASAEGLEPLRVARDAREQSTAERGSGGQRPRALEDPSLAIREINAREELGRGLEQ